jgi:hypothetical protein
MGPNFYLGVTSLGRNRLPPNCVAILDDPALLAAALAELHAYAVTPSVGLAKTRYSIIFRIVDDRELNGFHHKLRTLLDPVRFMDNAALYGVAAGQWHMIDSDHLTHVCNRHTEENREKQRGHVAVTAPDFQRIPDVIATGNITEFAQTQGRPRIIYRKRYPDGELTVIQEIRSKGMTFKTMYKKK